MDLIGLLGAIMLSRRRRSGNKQEQMDLPDTWQTENITKYRCNSSVAYFATGYEKCSFGFIFVEVFLRGLLLDN